MVEKTILIGVVVFILIVCLYNYLLMTQPCQRKVVYFSDEFDAIPQLKVVEEKTLQESMDSGDHLRHAIGGNKNGIGGDMAVHTNLMGSRWSGSEDSQPIKDSIGRTCHLDSIQASPVDFNPTVHHKDKFGKYVQHNIQRNKIGHSIKLEGLSDDEWLSQGSSCDKRDATALELHMPEVYDSKFNTPNVHNKVLNQLTRNPKQFDGQQMNMPYGSFNGMASANHQFNPTNMSQYDEITSR